MPRIAAGSRAILALDNEHARDIHPYDWSPDGARIGVAAGGGFRIHPDGRQIAFAAAAGKLGPEGWMIENIVSAPGSAE